MISDLISNDFIDCVENLRSIPTTKTYVYKNPFIKELDYFLTLVPLKVIFAYDGPSPETYQKYSGYL